MSKQTKIVFVGSNSRQKSECIELMCSSLLQDSIKSAVCPQSESVTLLRKTAAEDDFIKKNTDADLIVFDGCALDCSCEEIEKYGRAALWSRYDCVIFAKFQDDSKDFFEQKYVGHPHLRCVFGTNAADIAAVAADEVRCVLSDTETEMKFLIERPSTETLEKLGAVGVDIEQTYLLSPVGTHRIRKRGTGGNFAYYETMKRRISGTKSYEYENLITKSEYDSLMLKADPVKHTIKKVRYCFLFDEKYFELDVFDFWSDKALLEIELKSTDEQFSLPDDIAVIRDVSSDPHYKNSYLAGLNL